MRVPGALDRGQPFVLSEFGGISFDVADTADSWGYSTAGSATEFRARLASVLAAANTARGLAGFCYTQLTDTAQETNGLCTAVRQPKLPIEEIAHLVRNGPDPATPAGDPRA